jgi:subtilase family serine protease
VPRLDRCFAIVARQGRQAVQPDGEPAGYGATDLRAAYRIPNRHSHETVGVVVAYDYPSAEADLNAYRKHFGLPPCTSDSGCFTKINQRGEQGDYPYPDPGWSVEAALDMQMISAACPTCHIILAEADEATPKDLATTARAVAAAGAVVSNNSYGVPEHTGVRSLNASYNIPGVTAVASSGDEGYSAANFPASSPQVISVGGTVLHHAPGPRGWRENAWHYGGSGCSAYFQKPSYQHDSDCGMRTYADVSAVAHDVAVYDTFWGGPNHPWLQVDGTSISSPLIAGMIGAAKAAGIRPKALYAAPSHAFHDVRLGHNGFCDGSYICTSLPGYDGPTGLGTPRGLAPFTTG